MTDSPRLFHLGSPSDDLGGLIDFLRGAKGADVTIAVGPERPLSTPEVQLLLAAGADPAGPSSLQVIPASAQITAGLRLLGLEGRIEVAA